MSADPVDAWAAAVWEERAYFGTMELAWRKRLPYMLRPEQFRPSSPVLAVGAALARAGWSWPAWDHFRSRQGHDVPLRDVCPME
eukprot:6205999-Lingulodinium_polyedra.AAC.1